MNLVEVLENLKRGTVKNSPAILTGLAIGGLTLTAVLTGTAVPKAMRLIDEEYELRTFLSNPDGSGAEPPDFTWQDMVKITWKEFLPAASVGIGTAICILGSNSISSRRIAMYASAYSLAETAAREYRAKVLETIGEKKELAIRDAVAIDRVATNPPVDVFATGHGNHLMLDSLSGRYFYSDIEQVRRAVNIFNHDLMDDMCKTVNEFWEELNLPGTELGRSMGWDIGFDAPANNLLRVDYTTTIEPTTGAPCIVLTYNVFPKQL